MKLIVCAVRDAKVGAFTPPFFVRSRGEALRSFQDACGDEKAPFYRHAEDYELFVLGEWSDETGEFYVSNPVRVCGAVDFVVKNGGGP